MPRRRIGIVVVSANSARWLDACLSSVRSRAGDVDVDIIVVSSGSTDDTDEVAATWGAEVVHCDNHGFAYANNRGLEHISAEWVLFLNPDTKLVAGTLEALLDSTESHGRLGIAGVRQLDPDGSLQWSIRRSPSPARWLGEAVALESSALRDRSWAGERVLDPESYAHAVRIDWTSGSCMLARTTVVRELGGMDERFFLYCEEPDLCGRAWSAGWETWHLPELTIVHYGGNEQSDPRLSAQLAYSRRLYAKKHGTRARYALGVSALIFGSALRSVLGRSQMKRRCARLALRTLLRLSPPPFEALTASTEDPIIGETASQEPS